MTARLVLAVLVAFCAGGMTASAHDGIGVAMGLLNLTAMIGYVVFRTRTT